MKKILICLLFISAVAHADTQVYFSPQGGCQESVVSRINKAEKTIDIAMYYLTSREIAQELVKASERGVIIRVFLDQSQENSKFAKSRYLIMRSIEVRFYTGKGLMHNKFALIDNRTLITGSFNWTATADRENQENLLIMDDNDLIRQYSQRFELLWKSGKKGGIKLEDGGGYYD